MSDYTEFSDDELDDHEYPDPDDTADDGQFVQCPECRRHFYEDAEMCPHCGHAIAADTGVWSGKPWWWTVLAVLGVVGLIGVLILGR